MAAGMLLKIDVSAGELIDKITILEIKAERIGDPAKVRNVQQELTLLTQTRNEVIPPSAEITKLTDDLRSVNSDLWEIEDAIRLCEHQKDFGPKFIELARSVYRNNDRRADLKRRINELLGSTLVEEKSYAPYE